MQVEGGRAPWWVKPVVDRACGTALGLAALPVAGVVALAVLVSMGRPVLYRQRRLGIHGRAFEIVKFRTMREGDRPDEARITRVGRIIRRWSLDELPEIWNVLRGEMSLVGPRPLLTQYGDRYTAQQARRHEVKPGITGLAQVRGRNSLSWEEKFELDVWYVDHRSLWLDLEILWWTAWQVLRREGISHHGVATMPEFMGSGNEGKREGPAE